MNQDYIAEHIRRTNRNLFVLVSPILGISIYLIAQLNSLGQLINDMIDEPTLIEIVAVTFEFLTSNFLFIFGLFLLSKALIPAVKLTTRLINVQKHPIYINVASYGIYNEIAQNINYEVLKPENKQYNDVLMTENWILQKSIFGLNILKIEDVVWAYKRVEKHKQGFVGAGLSVGPAEVGKRFNVILHSQNPVIPKMMMCVFHILDTTEDIEGNAAEGQQKVKYVENILEELEQRHPKAIYGYSKDLYEMWNTDKPTFIKSAGF